MFPVLRAALDNYEFTVREAVRKEQPHCENCATLRRALDEHHSVHSAEPWGKHCTVCSHVFEE
jgi:hypothetical protein